MGVPAPLLHLLPLDHEAVDIIYDPATSGLSATNVQAAIDELTSASSGPFIRKDGTSTTTARIPFAEGILLDLGKEIYFRNSNATIASPTNGDIDIRGNTVTSSISLYANTVNLGGNGAVVNVIQGQFALGGSLFLSLVLNPEAVVFQSDDTFNKYFIADSVNERITLTQPLVITKAIGTAPLTITSTTVVTNLNADMVDGFHASSFALAARTITTTSPIRIDGGASADLSADRTLSWDFATNNTWTGTQKIDPASGSTTALFVEQNGVKDDVFIVDTTNGTVGIGVAPGTSAGLIITYTATASVLSLTRTLSTRITSSRAINVAETLSWTGAAIGGAAGPSVFTGVITDNRTLNSAATDILNTFAITLTRSASFSTGTTVTNTTMRAAAYVCNDSGVYNNTTANQNVNSTNINISGAYGFTINATGRVVTYNMIGMNTSFTFAPTLTAGTLNLNYKAFADSTTAGTAVGTTLACSFYSLIGGFDTMWFCVNDTTNPMYMGGDNAKSYWGTAANALGSFTGGIGDASIVFNGSALIIKSNEITAGDTLKLDCPGTFAGGTTTPTAILHLAGGTTTASTAPLKFTSGTSLTTAEAGAVEFTTDDLFFTITTGAARKNITLWDTLGTAGRIPFATTNGRLTDDADLTFATDTLTVTKIAATTFTGNITTTAVNIVTDTGTGTKIGTATNQKLGFFNAGPVVQPTDGATLTNNVTAGGTTNQIDDWTNLTVYATDAAAIRNAVYQLARKVKILTDNLRSLGLES